MVRPSPRGQGRNTCWRALDSSPCVGYVSAIESNQQTSVPFDREGVGNKLTLLAQRGVFIGTSSWKYPGWRGMLYDASRYLYRGKVAESRFEKQCLAEYAEVFKTVCVDGAYYRFPDRRYL